LGLEKVNKKTKFVMFLDDDIVFHKNSFQEMDRAIQRYKKDKKICGFGFNYIDKKRTMHTLLEKIKRYGFTTFFKLYSNKVGVVTQSGWQTKIINLKKDQTVEWIYTAACIFKFKIIKNIRFDESFGSYSYLEDLDFSLKLKKKIFIPYKAKFNHPNIVERNGFNFGFIEVRNRYIIVKKNNLVTIYFFIGTLVRFLISIISSFFGKPRFLARALGNVYGLLYVFFKNIKS
jgi:GT2 family glycosyltransferase